LISRALQGPFFYGSSRITGKDALDLHEKELAIPVTIRHPLDDLDSIVYAFGATEQGAISAHVRWPVLT
jgi:hypothetical protein